MWFNLRMAGCPSSFRELRDVKRPVGKPLKWYKDCAKDSLKKAGFDPKTWEEKMRTELWRDEVTQTVKGFEEGQMIMQS